MFHIESNGTFRNEMNLGGTAILGTKTAIIFHVLLLLCENILTSEMIGSDIFVHVYHIMHRLI